MEGDGKEDELEAEEVDALVTGAVTLSEKAEDDSVEEVSGVSEVGKEVKVFNEEVDSDVLEVSVGADEDSELESDVGVAVSENVELGSVVAVVESKVFKLCWLVLVKDSVDETVVLEGSEGGDENEEVEVETLEVEVHVSTSDVDTSRVLSSEAVVCGLSVVEDHSDVEVSEALPSSTEELVDASVEVAGSPLSLELDWSSSELYRVDCVGSDALSDTLVSSSLGERGKRRLKRRNK